MGRVRACRSNSFAEFSPVTSSVDKNKMEVMMMMMMMMMMIINDNDKRKMMLDLYEQCKILNVDH